MKIGDVVNSAFNINGSLTDTNRSKARSQLSNLMLSLCNLFIAKTIDIDTFTKYIL